MLSILIPIYNFDVNELVRELHQQATRAGIEFEIRCYDDRSESFIIEQNESINSLPYVVYIKLNINIGRSKIRNVLATDAKYEYLIFIDCDSKIVSEKYIEDYLKYNVAIPVICGGRSYCKTPPENKNKLLHWKYGVNREVKSEKERNVEPYNSFMTNNFLIKKSIFLSIRLDENMIGYGHEDTQFGNMLNKSNVKVLHIENVLEHDGLENSDTFIFKTNEAIKNLLYLLENNLIPSKGIKKIPLLHFFIMLKRTKTRILYLKCYELFKKRLYKNLLSENPSLFIFDLYKLYTIVELSVKEKS